MFARKQSSIPQPFRRVIVALFVLVAVIVTGTIAYMQVEHLDVFDAFYQTMIIISTLGIRQVREMDRAGDLITLFLIFGGVGAFTYAFSAMATLLVEGQLRKVLGRRKVDAKIASLRGHYVICGYGNMGHSIAINLKRFGLPLVVVDSDPEVTAQVEGDGLPYVLGNAHEEEILAAAGIARARGVVSVLPTDADNVFVTLTARGMSDRVFIIAKALDAATERKLIKAGANRVCNPTAIGANRITATLTHPTLVEFLDGVVEGVDIEVQELDVRAGSIVAGKSLKTSGLREKAGVMVIAIKRKDGRTYFSPPPDLVIEEDDRIVCVGKKGSTTLLEQYANP